MTVQNIAIQGGIQQTPRAGISKANQRMLLSCFLGTTIEWYDFLIYGFLAPLVFNKLFFPEYSSFAGTIAVFGIFAVGFAARPLGGMFFGHFGDRLGRKPILIATLSLMGLSTTAIGFTPTHLQIGIAAPVILVVLRFLQGFALGGESATGPLLATESAPDGKRGLFAAFVQSGAAAGTVLGALAAFAVAILPNEQLLSWGWRIPFIASAIIFAIGFYVRMKVEESPVFLAAIKDTAPEKIPLAKVFRHQKRPTLVVLLCAMAESSTFYFTSIFGLSYGVSTLHLDRGTLLAGVVIGNVIGIATNPLFGCLSDKIGRKPLVFGSYALSALYVLFIFFPLLATANHAVILIAMAIPGAILQPMSLAVTGSFYPEQFNDAKLRLSGVSVGRQFGTILGGGLMPMIATALLAFGGGALTWAVAYFVLICIVACSAVFSTRETSHGTLQ
ncbi:MAG TPA: MFS transporter [Eoetvoesiella sp.]|uniref:MFS transporter n=1 Tax=Eoetvoesiella sp. TaxID=1966355 RepID=UPI002C7379DC|nr:MFS transporter [Eoetvoesiella sp.]HWK63209.1 MFS transporter [Eoetvoesiella sp.]